VRTNRSVRGLQVVEDALKCKWDAVRWVSNFRRDLVNSLANDSGGLDEKERWSGTFRK